MEVEQQEIPATITTTTATATPHPLAYSSRPSLPSSCRRSCRRSRPARQQPPRRPPSRLNTSLRASSSSTLAPVLAVVGESSFLTTLPFPLERFWPSADSFPLSHLAVLSLLAFAVCLIRRRRSSSHYDASSAEYTGFDALCRPPLEDRDAAPTGSSRLCPAREAAATGIRRARRRPPTSPAVVRHQRDERWTTRAESVLVPRRTGRR